MNKLGVLIVGVASTLLLAGCSGGGSNHHNHKHSHSYMSKDHGKTYKKKRSHGNHHHHYGDTTHGGYYFNNYHGKKVYYPYSYYGTKHNAHTRMSKHHNYGQGYEAGCRTAWTGGMYKNPKLLSNSQSYQMGWEAGFNQCHYDRTHIDGDEPKYSYIPY